MVGEWREGEAGGEQERKKDGKRKGLRQCNLTRIASSEEIVTESHHYTYMSTDNPCVPFQAFMFTQSCCTAWKIHGVSNTNQRR